jgi:hypothetical protein
MPKDLIKWRRARAARARRLVPERACGPVGTNNAATASLAPVPEGDAAETGGRGVSEPHPTPVSQAVRRLALHPFLPAPLHQTFCHVV